MTRQAAPLTRSGQQGKPWISWQALDLVLKQDDQQAAKSVQGALKRYELDAGTD